MNSKQKTVVGGESNLVCLNLDIVDSIMKRLLSREKRESPYNNRLQRPVEERL